MKLQNIEKGLFSDIMARIYSVANATNQTQLAEFLGLRQATISDAKKRHSIPAIWLLKLLHNAQVNPEWIMTGQGPKFMQAVDSDVSVIYVKEPCPPEECSSEALLRELVNRALADNAQSRPGQSPGTPET